MRETIPEGWVRVPFHALYQRVVNGGTPDTGTQRFWNGTIPWVTGADFGTAGLTPFRRFVSDAGVRASATSVVPEGQLLVVTRTGVGKLAIAPCDVAISQDITGVYVNSEKADTKFVYYLLQAEMEELKKLNQDTSINGIVRSDLERHPVTIPVDKGKQRKIAAILTSLDTAIEKTEALIAKHQQIKAGLMHDLFTRGVLPNGQFRPLPHEAPEQFVPSVIGRLPAPWHLGGLAAKGRPGASWIRTGPFGSALKDEHWVSEGHAVITIGALGDGYFLEDQLLFVGARDAARLVDFQMKPGDVVFSRVADVGRSVVIRDRQSGWIMSSNLMRIAVDPTLVLPDFLRALLAGDARIKSQIRAKVNSSGREVANSQILGQLLFPWPPLDEQERIVERIESIADKLGVLLTQVRKLSAQKMGLMQALLGPPAVRPEVAATA